MPPMIGVVGALYILQGGTYVYESLFGKIQPSQQEFENLTAKQRRKRRKIERRKALAAGRTDPEGESEEQTPQESSTGLAEVMTANSSSDPVEEISQATPAQATTKHQGASQTKEQGRETSTQNKQAPEKDPKSLTSDAVDDSVPSTSSKIHPKNKVQLLTPEAKKGGKGKETLKHTCDSAKKNAPTTSSKEQSKKQPVTHNQRPSCEANAGKKGVKVMEHTKPSCDKAKKNVPTTSSKERPERQPAHKDQGLTSEADSAKTVNKGKEPKKHTCGNAQKNVATKSSKGQPKKYSTLQDQSPTCEASANKKGGKVKKPKTPSSDDAKKNVPTTSSKEQPKRQPAHKDQGLTLNAEAAQKGCKGKEPKKPSSDSAEKTDPTTSSKVSTKKKHPTKSNKCPPCKAHTVKKGGSREETEDLISENPEKCGPTTSVKQQLMKGQDHSEASTVKNTGKGKKPKKQSPNNMKSLAGAAASSREQVKEESTQKDQGPTSVADASIKEGKVQGVKSDTDKKMTTSVTPDQCIAKLGETPCMPRDSKEVADQSANSVEDSDSEWILVGKRNTTKNKTQPKTSAEPSQPKPGDKDQKAEETPKKKRPTRRAKKKPKKGKPKPSVTSAAKEEDSPVSPQEQNSTNVAVAPRAAAVNTWANIVKSKPNIDTLPLHNQDKAPGSQGEETQHKEMQKETELEEPVAEIPWNVPVMYKKCIGHKKKAPCVEQKTIIATAKIVEPLTKSSAGVTTFDMQEVQGPSQHPSDEPSTISPIIQDAGMEDFATMATLDSDKVCEPLQLPANQPSISSPDKQETDMKDSADVATPVKQESRESLPSLPNQANTDSPITREAVMKNSVTQEAQKPIPALLFHQEMLHVMGVSVPNFPVKLEDEREEEFEDLSAERHGTKLSMTHAENSIITPSFRNLSEESKPKDEATSVTVLKSNATQTGEPATPSGIIPSASEPLEQRRFTEKATGTKILTSTATQTDEHTLQEVKKSLLTCIPIKREPTGDKLIVEAEVSKLVPKTSTQDAPNMDFSQMSALSPAFVPHNTSPAVNPQTTLVKYIEDPTPQAVNSLRATTSVQERPSDHMLTINSEVQRSLPVRYAQGMPATNLPQMSAFNPAYSPYSTSGLIQQHGNNFTAVNPPTTLGVYIGDPSMLQYGTSYYQNHNYLVPATETWHMGYESTPYNAYSTYAPVHQRPILSPMVESYMQQTTVPVVPPRVAPTTKVAFPTVTCITKATPLQVKRQRSNNTADVKQVMQKPHQVKFSTIVHTTCAPLKIASSSVAETPKATAPPKEQQTNTTPVVKQVVQKPDQVTSSKVAPTTNAPLEITSPSATKMPKGAASLKQQQTNTTSALKQVVKKPDQVTSSKVAPTTNAPLEKTSPSATKTPKTVALLKQQTNTTPPVKQVVQKPDQVTSSKVMFNTNAPLQEASTSATKTPKAAAPPSEQQTNTTPAVKQVGQKPDQVKSSKDMPNTRGNLEKASPSATKTPKAAAPLKQQQTNTTPAVKQVGQKPDQVKSSKDMPNTRGNLEKASPSATKTPKAAAPLKEQQTNTTPAVKQVGQKPDKTKSSKDMPNTRGNLEKASPSATKTPQAAAPPNKMQTNTTLAVKQVGQKPDQVKSSKDMPNTRGNLEKASPSATKTPKAAAPPNKMQTNTTFAVIQVGQKPDQVKSSKDMPNTRGNLEKASPSATKTPKAAAPLSEQQTNTTLAVKQVGQKPDQVKSSKDMPNTRGNLEKASPSATKTPKAAAPLSEQQTNTTLAVKQVGQKPDQVKSSKDMPNTRGNLEKASPSATKTPKAATPLSEQQTNTTLAVKQVGQKPDQVKSSKDMPNTTGNLEKASPSATKTPKAAAPLSEQQTNTTLAVKQVGQKPDQVKSSKDMPNTRENLEKASPSATKTPTAAAPLKQQQTNATPAVKQVMQKPDRVASSKVAPTTSAPLEKTSPSATKTPKAAAPPKQQQTNTTPAVKQVVLKSDQATSSKCAPTTNAPLDKTSPSATETPKAEAAAPLKQQQTNKKASPTVTETLKAASLLQQQETSITPVKQVLQKQDYTSHARVVPDTSAAHEKASPTGAEIPEEARLLKKQLTNTTPIKKIFQKSDQMASSKAKPSTNMPLEKAAPTATKTPQAVALLRQTNATCAVKQVIKKSGHVPVPSSKNGFTTNAPLKKAARTATKKPKAATMGRNQQVNATPLKQVVQKPTHVTHPNEMTTANAPQGMASPVSTHATKTVATVLQQADNTLSQSVRPKERGRVAPPQGMASPVSTHATKTVATVMQQADNTLSQSVRPKERGLVAAPSSSKFVETSAISQTVPSAKDPKVSRATRRRRARARQRERKRAAEAERKKKERSMATETSEGAAAPVEVTEGTDSRNHHGEVASSSSSDIILNFDDDSEFVIDWEAEAAKPFYNSTEIFPPRVEIPEWAQWDFSQVCTILHSHLYWKHPGFQTKGITLMAATMVYIVLNITACWKYLSHFISHRVGYNEEDISWLDVV